MSPCSQKSGIRLTMVVLVGLVHVSAADAGSIVPADAKLEKLYGLKQKGILDTGEFKQEKKRVQDHQDEMRRIRRSKLVSMP